MCYYSFAYHAISELLTVADADLRFRIIKMTNSDSSLFIKYFYFLFFHYCFHFCHMFFILFYFSTWGNNFEVHLQVVVHERFSIVGNTRHFNGVWIPWLGMFTQRKIHVYERIQTHTNQAYIYANELTTLLVLKRIEYR